MVVHKDARVADFWDGSNRSPRFGRNILDTDVNSGFLAVALPFLALQDLENKLILEIKKQG